MTEQNKLQEHLIAMKQSLLVLEKNSTAIGGWLPKKSIKKFFDYGETQLRTLEREQQIEVSKIGSRKFYSEKSIIDLLEKSKVK
jgi:hypothetical protein